MRNAAAIERLVACSRQTPTFPPVFPGQKSAKSSCIKSTYKANKLELALCHFNLADLARDKNAENSSTQASFRRREGGGQELINCATRID